MTMMESPLITLDQEITSYSQDGDFKFVKNKDRCSGILSTNNAESMSYNKNNCWDNITETKHDSCFSINSFDTTSQQSLSVRSTINTFSCLDYHSYVRQQFGCNNIVSHGNCAWCTAAAKQRIKYDRTSDTGILESNVVPNVCNKLESTMDLNNSHIYQISNPLEDRIFEETQPWPTSTPSLRQFSFNSEDHDGKYETL